MGTSLSGLTPATTFDGLLKVGDNDPLTATLKPISTGDGTDTMLELSTSALQIGGATGMYWDNTNKRLGINNTSPAAPLEVNGEIRSTSLIRLMIGGSNKVLMQNANTIINSDVAIGQATAPTSRLHIKGSGATSATTSLLVQNSAGTDLFKVVDDNTMFYHTHKFRSAGGYLYIECEGNVDRSLKIGPAFTATSYSGHIFKTWDGTAFSEAMRITGNTNQFVGIGETTPTARLHVKGSGNDNTTTSLLVQNSDGTELLKVLDDGATTIKSNGSFSFETIAGTKRIEVKANGEVNLKGGQLAAYSSYNSSNSSLIVGNFTSPTARLQVKGSGATSATTSLLVQNSAGVEHLKVTDDGNVNIRQNLFVNHPSVSSRKLRLDWGSIYAEDNSSELSIGAVYSQNTSPRITLGGKTRSSGADAVLVQTLNGMYIAPTASAENPSAQLQVKGSGNDAATTALLVQNSDGTDTFKVLDDGNVQVAEYIYPADGTTNSRFRVSNSAGTYMYYSTGNLKLNPNLVYTSTTYGTVFSVSNSTGDFSLNGATGAKMAIKGNGATSATTALLVENSAGTELLKVLDDGQLEIKSNSGRVSTTSGTSIFSYSSGGGGVLDVNPSNNNSVKFRARGDNDTFLIQTNPAGDNVGIGASSPDSTAKLQVDSTTQGFLPPRMTTTERDAITTPAAGLMVYNTTTNKAQCYNGTAWQDLF